MSKQLMRFALVAFACLVFGGKPAAEMNPQQTAGAVTARSGWLYVVTSDYREKTGRLTLVDPNSGEIKATWTKGYELDLTLTPSGERGFLSYQRLDSDAIPRATFEVFDAVNGKTLLALPDEDPWPSIGSSNYFSRMAVSANGRWLYRYKVGPSPAAVPYVQLFDITRNAFLPTVRKLPECTRPRLIPSSSPEGVYVVCSDSQEVKFVRNSAILGDVVGQAEHISVLGSRRESPSTDLTAFFDATQRLKVIKGTGAYVDVSLEPPGIIGQGVIDRASRGLPQTPPPGFRSASDWLAERSIRYQKPVFSPDKSRLFLMVQSKRSGEIHPTTREIVVLEAGNLTRVSLFSVSGELVNLAMSPSGTHLYGIDSIRGVLLVMNPITGAQLRSVSLGTRPVFAVPIP